MATLNELVKQHGLLGVTFISPEGYKIIYNDRFEYEDNEFGCIPDLTQEGWTVEEPEYTCFKWVNIYSEVYSDAVGCNLFASRDAADKGTSPNRIACVKVEIKWKRGQFDE